jgi:lysophospholipase L1-like esterase
MAGKRILIFGDSQAGAPGTAAERKLRAQGHQVQRISNVGKGPYDYTRFPTLWEQYVGAVRSFQPDIVLAMFGSNDEPNENLATAISRIKQAVRPTVLLTGPPQYPAASAQARGAAIRAIYARAAGSDFIDAYPFTDPSLPRSPDGLHLPPASAAPWGEAAAAEVERRLAAGPLASGLSDRVDRSSPRGRGGSARRARRNGNDDA